MIELSSYTKNLFSKREAKGEVVGGGYIVIRRGDYTNRLRVPGIKAVGKSPNMWGPFEYPTVEAAYAEAARLSHLHPGKTFCVFQQINAVKAEEIKVAAE